MEQTTISKEELLIQIQEFIPTISTSISGIETSKLFWLYNQWFSTDEQVPKGGCSKCNSKIILRILNALKAI